MFVQIMPLGPKLAPSPRCHQGHSQLSTDTYIDTLNKTQVSDLGSLGLLVCLCIPERILKEYNQSFKQMVLIQTNVSPDLGPNFLQRLSANDTSRQRDKC